MYFRLRVNSAKRSNASISPLHDEYKNFLCSYCGTVTISFRKCLGGAKTNTAVVRQESLQASLFSPLQSLYLKGYLPLVFKTDFGEDQILVIQYTLFAIYSLGIAMAKLTVKKISLEGVAGNYYIKAKRDYALKNQYFRSHFQTLISHME